MTLFLFLIYFSVYADFTGFVTSLWRAKNRSGNEYIDAKLKTDVCQYTTIRIMGKQNPVIKDFDFKNFQAGNVHVKFCNLSITTNGTLFFNTFRGSKIDEGVAVSLS